jgi:hypothetical protein
LDISHRSLDGIVPDPVYAILLAHSCDVPQILTPAFYVLSQQPTKPKKYMCSLAHIKSRALLTVDDLETLALGRENIVNKFSQSNLLNIFDWTCPNDKPCDQYVWSFWGDFLERMVVERNPLWCLRYEARSMRDGSTDCGDQLCPDCQHSIADNMDDARRDLFNRLSKMFGLE